MKTINLTPRTERWPKDQEWKITSIRIPIDVARGIELRAKAADCRSPSDAIIQILAQYVEGTETPRKSAKVFLEWALKADKSARKDYSEKDKANGKSKPKAAKKAKVKAASKTKAKAAKTAKPRKSNAAKPDQPQLPGTGNGADGAPAVQGEPGPAPLDGQTGTQADFEAKAQPEGEVQAESDADAANEPRSDTEPRAAAPGNLGPDGEQMAF